jgi:cytidine deaminase
LTRAVGANASWPVFSGYEVRVSIAQKGQPPRPAGNCEYGLCQAIHGEEAAVAVFLSLHGYIKADAPVLAAVAHKAGNVPACCGNCRDVLRAVFGSDLEVVAGHPDGGTAVVVPMSAYLVDSYPRAKAANVLTDGTALEAWDKGDRLVNDAFSPEGHDLRKYAAVVVTERGSYFGGRQVMCDYHPIYAVEDAIRAAERKGDTFLREVFIVCQGDGSLPPDVMYRDRQRLHGFTMQSLLAGGREIEPLVLLATIQGTLVTGLWYTTVKRWLPIPFTARKFADMTRLEAYYKKRFPR